MADRGWPAGLTPSLVSRLREGDPHADATLDTLYRKHLLRFCMGYLKNPLEAEDAVQDVFGKVLKSTTVPDDFRAWLYKIARNRCLDMLRSRGRRRDDATLPSDSQLDVDQTGNLTHLVREEQRARLRELLAALPESQREVLLLRYTEELSRAEIAHVLDLPESVVKSRLFEGLQKLRAHPSLLDEG